MQENGIQTIEQSAFSEKCEEYELQPDGSYVCDDDDYSGSEQCFCSSMVTHIAHIVQW